MAGVRVELALARRSALLLGTRNKAPAAAPAPAQSAKRAQQEIADNEDEDAADPEAAGNQRQQATKAAASAAKAKAAPASSSRILEVAAFPFVAEAHALPPVHRPNALGRRRLQFDAGLARERARRINMFLQGKVALVTGSTSGIGLAIAKGLAAEGAKLMINGFGDPAAIERECDELGALHDGADMSKPAEIERMMKRCADELGGPDILVNNAGIQHVSPVDDFPPAKWDAIIAINLSSAFHTTRLAVPGMKHKQWGRIINTASAHSLVASQNKSAYVAAKHGIAGLTKSVALETARDGITVNCISPGYVWTELVERQIPDTMKTRGLTREQVMNDVLLAAQPTKRFVAVDEVAALAVFLCRDEARSITGANLSMDGGWTAA
jgi:3-hydroxybutyrate dehydrogenase